MRKRLLTTLLVALAATFVLAATANAAMLGIYRNELTSLAQRTQLVKLTGADCARSGVAEAMQVVIGKKTPECAYRTPVLGRNLEIGATETLKAETPKATQPKAFLGLTLRAGEGAKYQLLVFPKQRKVQLVKTTSEGTEFLAIAKNQKGVLGVEKANALRLRALTTEKGVCELSGYLGAEKVVEATDEEAGELPGIASGISIGATKGANGLVASIDNVVVRVPSPF